MKVAVYHPLYRENPTTYLADAVAAGATSISVKNTDGFTTTKYVAIGIPGLEQSELMLPSTVTSPGTISFGSALKFPHNSDTQVRLLDYNQIKIYRSITGIDGSYTLLTTIDITIDADDTQYEDQNSQPTYYYKFSYYNEATDVESDLSDAIAATGFVFYSLKTLIDRVLALFGDAKGDFVTREEVRDFLNEFYEKGQQEVAIATKRHGILTHDIELENDVVEYDLPSDLFMEKDIKVSTDGGTTFEGHTAHVGLGSHGKSDAGNIIYGYTIYNSVLRLDRKPTSSSHVLRVYYYPTPATLNLQTDTLASPFQNSTSLFIRYALAMCYLKDKKWDEYRTLNAHARDGLEAFISFIKRLQNRHPEYMTKSF